MAAAEDRRAGAEAARAVEVAEEPGVEAVAGREGAAAVVAEVAEEAVAGAAANRCRR